MASNPAAQGKSRMGDPVQVIADSPLMRAVDRSTLDGLSPDLDWVELGAQEALFLDGQHGDALYFVASGRLEILQATREQGSATDGDAEVLTTLAAGDAVGEMGALTGRQGSAAIRCIFPARLVRLAKERLDRYLAANPDANEKLQAIFAPRFHRLELAQVLGNMFGDLSDDILADIEQRLTWRHVRREKTLIGKGEVSDRLFVLVSGRLHEIATDDLGGKKVADEIVQGGTVGESGVFTDDAQTTTVVAARDSALLEFSRQDFQELAEKYPKLSQWIMRLLSLKLRGVFRKDALRIICRNIVLVPITRDIDLGEFAEEFSRTLSQHQEAFLVTGEMIDTFLGVPGICQAAEGTPEDARILAWINQQETDLHYMVCPVDYGLTNWTKRCIRQADEIILVGTARETPKLTATETQLLRDEESRGARLQKILVLIHPPDTSQPEGTLRWLSERSVDRHFHARPGNHSDLERIVRHVSGRELGLVLSGGGYRGFAHVGVIRALRESGLAIDFIAGVSFGSIIAGAYSYSEELDQTIDSLKSLVKGMLSDYTLPLISLIRGRRFDNCLQTLFGETNIEDLWIPYFCVSSNLTRAETVIHQTGSLWRAARASSTLPGLVSPVVMNGDLLYDGCLLNNLPVDRMREEIQTGSLIAVDVVPPVDFDFRAPNLESPSGWQIAWNRINPFTNRLSMPGIISIIHRAGALGSISNRQQLIDEDIADLYLRPPVGQFDILDVTVADEAMEIGYTYSLPRLRSWTEQER